MLVRRSFLSLLVCSALALTPTLASGQVLFSDTAFAAASYTSTSAGNSDIRYGFNYATYDIFGDGFLINSAASIPVAPRTTDGSRTGLFLSANNSTLAAPVQSFAGAIPNGVNVGTGTANPNYVLRVDVFHSTGAGVDANGIPDGTADISLVGSTNYAVVGLNQTNTVAQVSALNAPGATGNLAGQGLGLAATADGGGAEDYAPLYGGAFYRDRPGTVTAGQFYTGTQAGQDTGLLGDTLNDYWLAQGLGFELVNTDANTTNDLNIFTGDSLFFAPDPANTAGFAANGSGADKSPLVTSFPAHNAPLHYNQPSLAAPATLAPNNSGVLAEGVVHNQWKTHELFWVDGKFTYVIDGTPVLQITPDNDGLGGNDNVFNSFSSAGSALLAFWDRFGGSIATSPEGANFVIYDNLEIAVATAAQVPDMLAYLGANGYLLAGDDADFDADGDVDGQDFLTWQRGLGLTGAAATLAAGNANGGTVIDGADLAIWRAQFGLPAVPVAGAVPEPTSAALLACVAVAGLLGRGHRRVR